MSLPDVALDTPFSPVKRCMIYFYRPALQEMSCAKVPKVPATVVSVLEFQRRDADDRRESGEA